MRSWLAVVVVLGLTACDDGKITELGRFPSPAGDLDAVIGTMQAGENSPYLVTVVKTGDKADKGTRVLLADKLTDARVEWQDGDHMVIRCGGEARIWSFRNFWSSPSTNATLAVGLDCGLQGWR